MHRMRFGWLALILIALLISGTEIHSALKRDTPEARKLQRELAQRRVAERQRQETNLDWVRSRAIGGDESYPATFDRSIIREPAALQSSYSASAMAPPPPSPGIELGRSSYDYQANYSQGYQVGRTSGADIVHFVWMSWDRIPSSGIEANDRYVTYSSYTVSTNTINQGNNGVFLGLGVQARAGYINLDIGAGNVASATCHQREDVSLPYNPWHLDFPSPGSGLHIDDGLGGYAAGGCPEVLWPRNAASRDAGNSGVRHIIAHSNTNDCETDLLWYWRYNGSAWTGPVIIDSTPWLSYVMADDPNSSKLAVAVNVSNHSSMMGINNVAYLQSLTDGAGWINNSEPKTKTVITNYNNEDGPGAWLHLTTTYDNSSVLHIIFDEQQDANDNALTAIRHWNSSRNTIRPVALNYAETPLLTGVFNLNLAKVTMGIGDGATVCGGGTNNNYVYATYTKFGGSTPAEQADASLEGRYNGELYLSVSNSGGNTWAPPVNLSNTKTPYCNPGSADTTGWPPQRPDSVCRSEHWATIGRVVGDIDIFFISDIDAGGVIQGEGSWQMNPVHYYRIPGGTPNSQFVCPATAASIEVTLTKTGECEYHAPQAGSNDETLTLINLGNALLFGTVTVSDFPGAPTLTLSGGEGAYSIPAGGADIVHTVTMTSNGAPEGFYHGEITITHNDVSPIGPRIIPIDFFVFNEFFCPEDEVLKTGVASPGSLALEIESNGRFGSQNAEGGLWRHIDSSSSIFDASLLIAHGTQSPDTTVFRRFYDNPANGQFGFRALGDMIVDTASYGTGDGCATAVARMCTRDSVVGIQVEWVFPQDPADDELVLCRYKVYRHDAATAVSDLAIGILVDADAIPAARLESIQNGATNSSGVDGTRNLVWVAGVDTSGHIPSGTNTATRFRGGIAVPGAFEGAAFGNNVSDLQPGGGPKDQFLYTQLQSLTGTEPYPGDTDLYVLVAFDRGQSIAVGETLNYVVIYASDTLSELSLKAKVDRGIELAAYPSLCRSECLCICAGDPRCDGVISDVLDVITTVNVAFRGEAAVIDPECPYDRTDVNCSGSSEVIDVVKVVNVAFRGANAVTEFCVPCQ